MRSTSGKLVPLDAVARLARRAGPLTVNHAGQLPAVNLSFNLAPGRSIGDAVAVVERLSDEVLPPTVTTRFQGTAQAFQESLRGLGLLLVMAVLVIYVVLGILYESLVHPITILTALPFAGFGALLTLYVFHAELSVYAFVGIIMLVGLVKKNGIMMVDFAIEAQRVGLPAHEAIREACRDPLPPHHDDHPGRADGHACPSRSAGAPEPTPAARSAWPWWAGSSSRSSSRST